MANQAGIADQALGIIAAEWQADGDRVQWLRPEAGVSAGFDWWPGDFRVGVRATLPSRAVGKEAWSASDGGGKKSLLRLSVKTAVLKDMPISDGFAKLLSHASRLASPTYAWVYPPGGASDDAGGQRGWMRKVFGGKPKPLQKHSMSFESTAYVWSDDSHGWVAQFVGKTALFQAINAQIQAATFASVFHRGAADVTRPAALSGAGLDPILETIEEVYVPAGKQPSRWIATGEFEKFAEEWGRSEHCVGVANPMWLALQTPFGNEVATIHFHTDQRHPQLGNGLLVTMQLPVRGSPVSLAKTAADLNFREARSWTDFPLLGNWALTEGPPPEKEANLAFGLFVPNGLYQRYLVEQIAFWCLERARWARLEKYPELPEVLMGDILERQYGHLMKDT